MTFHRFVNVGIIATTLCIPALAFGAFYISAPGNTCQPAFGNTTVDQDDFGVGNQSTSATNSYICPMPYSGNSYGYDNVADAHVYMFDASSTSEFRCYPFVNTPSGSQYWGNTRWACSTAGGCADTTTTFTGLTNISWNSSMLPYYIQIYGYEEDWNFGFRCDLPPATSTSWSGRSWIISYDWED